MSTQSIAPQSNLSLVARVRASFRDVLLVLSDFWFGMSMLGVWGVMTLIGVVVDQDKDASFYTTNYAPALARLVLRLHLDNIYHSAAYIAIIGLILACMTLATFWRVIPTRMPPLRPVKIERIPLNASVHVNGDEASVRARVERFFSERGWTLRKRDVDGVEWSFLDKHNWARRGVLVAHVGFVIIAAGTSIYWAQGYSGQTAILAGETQTIPENGTRIALDRFRYRIDPIQTKAGTVYQPIDYVSDVHAAGRDQTSLEPMTLRVNHPLDIDGTSYYQASYGFAISFVVTQNGKPLANSPQTPLKEGQAFALGASSRAVQYSKFVGTIDPRGNISPDPRVRNPGAVLSFFDGDQPLGQVLVPIGKSLDLGSGYAVTVARYTLYSGIQYRHDPGIPLVGLGAFVLLGGLCVSFYFLPARLYARIDGEGRAWTVGLAATTVKGYEIFEEQFRGLVTAFERDLEPAAPARTLATAGAPGD